MRYREKYGGARQATGDFKMRRIKDETFIQDNKGMSTDTHSKY
jgi:hypothetical protein